VDIDGRRCSEVLFVKNSDLRSQFWTGFRMNVSDAEILGIEKVESMDSFKPVMERLFSYKDTLFLETVETPAAGTPSAGDSLPNLKKYGMASNEIMSYVYKYKTVVSPIDNKLSKLREVKDSDELKLMQAAGDITVRAFENTIKAIKPGIPEYGVQAEMEYWFRKQGAEGTAFPSITGSGANTCIIHYMSNRDTVHAGDLVLMDCGAEYHGYASDVTRTVPADGKFTNEQKIIYNIVLEAHDSAVAQCQPGKFFMATQIKAMDIISRRLKEIGVIKEIKDYKNYFPHGVSHYVGLDVHDVGTYSALKPGNVVTIEPGIYIPEGIDCDKKWWNIGVRIEDDVLITDAEPIVLTGILATRAEDIEKMMGK
jgi:Xaa-Pro aminopeptidase